MLPVYAKDVLHGSSQLLGFLQGFFGLGAMTGAFAVAAFITMRKLPNAIFTLVLLHSICMIIFGLSTNHYFSLVMMVPAGFGLISSLIATTDGSLNTIPFPFTYAITVAVPKSIPISCPKPNIDIYPF